MSKVTVILTSYNHAKYIREAIESTLNQTFTDFELVILDDCSSDSSWEVISQYADPRIRAYRNTVNMGGSVGINRVISETDPRTYIAMHHSDDVWEANKLEKEIAFLDAHPEVGAVFSNALAIDEGSVPLTDQQHFYSDVFDQPNRSRHEWLRHFFLRGNALCHPSVLIRKVCYENCGSYPYTLAQLGDFDMWVRLCLKYEIHVLPEQLVKFRVRDNEANTSGSRPDVRIRDRSEFQHILKRYFRIESFEELASIFPEAKPYYRAEGCEPRFVMAMTTLGMESLPWATSLAIATLFDLLDDADTSERIKALYQFDYRDLIKLTGKYDLFALETVAHQANEISRRDDLIAMQARQPNELAQMPQSTRASLLRTSAVSGANRPELPVDRSAYQQAAQMLESGRVGEGKVLLEGLASKGSSCWDVYNDLAVQYFNEGDYARATLFFEKGMALEGDAGTTAGNFASMLLTLGDVEGALEVWGGILHKQPQDEAVLEIVREVLSNINPIPPNAWRRLVSDIASGLGRDKESGTEGGHRETAGRPGGAVSGPEEKEIRIFQIYYDENTRSLVDPSFIPLDNTENARPDWCEYWSIRKVLLSQSFDDDTYLGFFSPRFFEKTAMSGSQVLEHVRNSNADVISFSPYFDQGALHPSPFYHGESHHHGLLNTAQNVLAMLNVNLDLNALICDQTTTIFSNYFVARYSFWKKWFAYAEKIFNVCEGPDCELKSSLVDLTQHRNSASYAMKVFILERLVTIVMEEQHIRSEVAIDVRKAPLSFPQSRAILDKLMVCDALKSQFLKTGLSPFVETYVMYRNKLLESKLT